MINRENEIEARLADIRAKQEELRKEEESLREERASIVTALDRATMKRRGNVSDTWAVTEKWSTAAVCPFCLTACASRRQGKGQNAEYHCGNPEAIA